MTDFSQKWEMRGQYNTICWEGSVDIARCCRLLQYVPTNTFTVFNTELFKSLWRTDISVSHTLLVYDSWVYANPIPGRFLLFVCLFVAIYLIHSNASVTWRKSQYNMKWQSEVLLSSTDEKLMKKWLLLIMSAACSLSSTTVLLSPGPGGTFKLQIGVFTPFSAQPIHRIHYFYLLIQLFIKSSSWFDGAVSGQENTMA